MGALAGGATGGGADKPIAAAAGAPPRTDQSGIRALKRQKVPLVAPPGSDDPVAVQSLDVCGIQPEPFAKDFVCVFAQERRRLDRRVAKRGSAIRSSCPMTVRSRRQCSGLA